MTRASAARSRMLPTDRRTQILSAARRMLEHRSIDEISVEAVAGEAGVSPGLLFHYFGSQRKFRYAVLQMAAEELLSHVRPDPALSIAEQLRAGVETFVDYVSRFPTIYLAVTRLSRGDDVRELHSSARGVIGGWITEGIESVGVDVTPALRLTVNAWLAFMEEAVLGWLARPELTQAELIDMCERSFYHLAKGALDDERRWQEILDLLNKR
ncbi:TetR/AcrR family transcriptional regulator [Streptomyces sp. GMY01]|uniref:TetR/AcrR family transcriptional regulator n=1 Tax=Streptomyces sp. GMY02 TaxID=1333528 RepID=UPI00146A5DC2|nr:TetR/AcrR family transcriptional regulator [Streptomyces sp. GMY02]NMO34314.1 TetR/AcrR family transcriptional regulator [Streptomyces sp. GMY02]